ncbi:sigma factor-like helix-turn-helix DNA-binding protein [Kibdelosporangium aridum]|uniref:sigma factor-like helix-turn-helix DNA-binding protein n=1 Tax=Kibdelosporangium aridum TaxID=2030 RepID=UPI0035ECAC0C
MRGVPLAEVAARLNLTRGSVRVGQHRALHRLRDLLAAAQHGTLPIPANAPASIGSHLGYLGGDGIVMDSAWIRLGSRNPRQHGRHCRAPRCMESRSRYQTQPVNVSDMAGDHDMRTAARRLAEHAHHVGRVSGWTPWRDALQWLSRGKLGRPQAWPRVPRLTTPWQDTISAERPGWRQRAANLNGDEFAFAVDYRVCRRCRLGWVEQPYTDSRFQRCGLARAGLAALRADHPGLNWHTLGGHLHDSQPFWAAVGLDVPGGYQQRELCPHVQPR